MAENLRGWCKEAQALRSASLTFCVGTTHTYQTEGAECRGIEFLRSYKQTSKTLLGKTKNWGFDF